jgi:hypothetical protein
VNQFQSEAISQNHLSGHPNQGNQATNQYQGVQPSATNTNLPTIQLPAPAVIPSTTTLPGITDDEMDKLFEFSPGVATTSSPVLSNGDSGSLANLQIIGGPSIDGQQKSTTHNQSPSTSENGEPIYEIDIRGNFIKTN